MVICCKAFSIYYDLKYRSPFQIHHPKFFMYRHIWAAAWQNQQNAQCTQRRLRSRSESSLSAWKKVWSLASHKVHNQTGLAQDILFILCSSSFLYHILIHFFTISCGHYSWFSLKKILLRKSFVFDEYMKLGQFYAKTLQKLNIFSPSECVVYLFSLHKETETFLFHVYNLFIDLFLYHKLLYSIPCIVNSHHNVLIIHF